MRSFMKDRRSVRLAVATGAALIPLVASVAPAAPAAAGPDRQSRPRISKLDITPETTITAARFPTKGCDGVPGGAKDGTEAWVFSRPANAQKPTGYLFRLVDPKRAEHQRDVWVVVIDEGAYGAEITQVIVDPPPAPATPPAKAPAPANAGPTTTSTATANPAPTPTRPVKFWPPVDNPHRVVAITPVPEGVSGGMTETGGWLRLPAGWEIAYGEYQDRPETGAKPARFSVQRVCVPSAGQPAPAPAPGGGSLPLTGARTAALALTGVVVLLIGAALFIAWRRRAVRFVA
jgi:LPXTG-motif cell wall-anchored protein